MERAEESAPDSLFGGHLESIGSTPALDGHPQSSEGRVVRSQSTEIDRCGRRVIHSTTLATVAAGLDDEGALLLILAHFDDVTATEICRGAGSVV